MIYKFSVIPLICGLSNLRRGQPLRLTILPWLLFVLLHYVKIRVPWAQILKNMPKVKCEPGLIS